MYWRLSLVLTLIIGLASCMTNIVRLPSSVSQVYSNNEVVQGLLLAAQNNVLINIPESTTREFEKSEIDQKCRQVKNPFWSEKLVSYLNELKKRPELFSRMHVIEIKRADNAGVEVQRDIDGAIVVSIQYVKSENHNKVNFQTKLPCSGSIAEFFGRDIVQTQFEFPDMQKFLVSLKNLPEKKHIERFSFSNNFLTYLAERGAIFKFSHEMSFEKTAAGKYVMVELLNKLGSESKSDPFYQNMNYWFKQITEQSDQAKLIQMFAAIQDKELKTGVRVDSKPETAQKIFGDSDLTYLYITYVIENNEVNYVKLQELEECLEHFTDDMSGIRIRKPAANERQSYLRPGYSCVIK